MWTCVTQKPRKTQTFYRWFSSLNVNLLISLPRLSTPEGIFPIVNSVRKTWVSPWVVPCLQDVQPPHPLTGARRRIHWLLQCCSNVFLNISRSFWSVRTILASPEKHNPCPMLNKRLSVLIIYSMVKWVLRWMQCSSLKRTPWHTITICAALRHLFC